ncbi:hypothetical protein QTP70_008765 [Hemibagrus guttatus]|uniref:SGNH hydrolase-type esterase domain-containing protein n=1 Tax=Hemibagrus guttatus TaxID=175788 RepID=A0AAE0UZ89_9TELE|nr:hypothetical protein QTP70_008765 [Hemibagrus guttatus]
MQQQQRKTRAKPRARTSPPPPPPVFEISTQNRFAPLRETACDVVIIGDSIVRHVRATAAKGKVHTRCLPGARVLDVSAQVPAILKKNIGAVVLHAGTNNIGLRQTEILKKDFRSLVELVRTTSPTTRIIVSGPLPTFQRGIERVAGPVLHENMRSSYDPGESRITAPWNGEEKVEVVWSPAALVYPGAEPGATGEIRFHSWIQIIRGSFRKIWNLPLTFSAC